MSEGAEPLRWSVVDSIDGVDVHAFFFMPHSLGMLDPVRKELPVFGKPLPEPVHHTGTDFKLGRLQGSPDALYLHGNGYLSVTRAAPSDVHNSGNWQSLLRPLEVWTALANAMSVSAAMRLPAAALLRAEGALYFLAPSADAMRHLLHALTATEVGQPPLSAAEVAQSCLQPAQAGQV